ncbi:MAG: hydroxyacid dehydrogenase [Clostridiaceae bacterium]|nr:hydroxyacid dehydrogenase [Clostridiaceae bacterium]
MRIVLLEPLAIDEEKLNLLSLKLKNKGHEFIYYNTRTEEKNELIKRAAGAQVVILSNIPFTGEIINACPELKMISVAFTGVDHIDMQACRQRGIVVCNAAGYSTHSVAELTFGLILSVMRKVIECNAATRAGGTKNGLIGNEIFGKTLGIVGTGAIGLRVAEIGKAFGLKILAYSRSQKESAINMGISYVDLDTLLSESDIVTLHVPLTAETKGMINEERIAKMKPGSILINTARGSIVDSAALARALCEHRIAGAGVDVFEMEPPLPKDHVLFSAPNVVLTPHVAFATREAFERRAKIVFDNILLWLEGRPQNVMN